MSAPMFILIDSTWVHVQQIVSIKTLSKGERRVVGGGAKLPRTLILMSQINTFIRTKMPASMVLDRILGAAQAQAVANDAKAATPNVTNATMGALRPAPFRPVMEVNAMLKDATENRLKDAVVLLTEAGYSVAAPGMTIEEPDA